MIDKFMLKYGYTGAKLASLLGVTRQAVYLYRTNQRPIPKTIKKLLLLLTVKKNRDLLK